MTEFQGPVGPLGPEGPAGPEGPVGPTTPVGVTVQSSVPVNGLNTYGMFYAFATLIRLFAPSYVSIKVATTVPPAPPVRKITPVRLLAPSYASVM